MYYRLGHWTSIAPPPPLDFYTIRNVDMGNDCMVSFTFQIVLFFLIFFFKYEHF